MSQKRYILAAICERMFTANWRTCSHVRRKFTVNPHEFADVRRRTLMGSPEFFWRKISKINIILYGKLTYLLAQ